MSSVYQAFSSLSLASPPGDLGTRLHPALLGTKWRLALQLEWRISMNDSSIEVSQFNKSLKSKRALTLRLLYHSLLQSEHDSQSCPIFIRSLVHHGCRFHMLIIFMISKPPAVKHSMMSPHKMGCLRRAHSEEVTQCSFLVGSLWLDVCVGPAFVGNSLKILTSSYG